MTGRTALERAFELARSGKARSLEEIRARLKSEGLDVQQIAGPLLIRQLRDLIESRAGANQIPVTSVSASNDDQIMSSKIGRRTT